ncbi:MAG: N-acetylmuramoyl-L-alanine amidase, partial [Acidimicrobiales bacterium]|nr:N-acetylmuramoyl-L-alanine amidase [Acidimicrobiales bacterium]
SLPSPTSTTSLPSPIRDTGTKSGIIVTKSGVTAELLVQSAAGFLVRSPCGNQVLVPEGQPIARTQIVLDPGHGGRKDPGAVSRTGLKESDINLSIALATQLELRRLNISSVLTRTGNYSSLLNIRALLADALNADALISIHHNSPSANPSTTPGTEVYVQSKSAQSQRLGALIYEKTFAYLSSIENINWVSRSDAGVIQVLNSKGSDAYGIIRRPATPSILLELSYLSNPPEVELITSDAYAKNISQAIAAGIQSFLMTDKTISDPATKVRLYNPGSGLGSGSCDDALTTP